MSCNALKSHFLLTFRSQMHHADGMHSSMSNGARLDVVLDPYNPWGARLGAWSIGVSSLPVNTASVARNTALTSTLTSNTALRPADQPVRAARARPPEDRGMCGLGGAFGRGEARCIHIFVYMCAWSHANCVPARIIFLFSSRSLFFILRQTS